MLGRTLPRDRDPRARRDGGLARTRLGDHRLARLGGAHRGERGLGHRRRDRRHLDHLGRRQRGEHGHRPLVGDGPAVRRVFTAPNEEPERVEPDEDGLDGDAPQGPPVLADLAEHVLDVMGEVADQPAPDGVGSALERVDRPEQRRDVGIGRAIALERDERLRHRLQMLDGLRDEILEDVRLVDEEPVQLLEPSCGLRRRASGAAGTIRSSASAIALASSAPVAPITSSAVLSDSTMSDSAASALRSGTGVAAARSTASSIAAASAATWGNPLSAAEPRRRWVTTTRGSSAGVGSDARPSAARPSSTAARVSHASIKNTLSRNCRSPSATPSPVGRGLRWPA